MTPRREAAFFHDRLEGLSRMRGNSHVRFLGEERMATSSPYPTKGREKKWTKKVPSQGKGVGTFSFWDGFEVGIRSTGSLPDLHLHFALERDGRTEEGSWVTRSG